MSAKKLNHGINPSHGAITFMFSKCAPSGVPQANVPDISRATVSDLESVILPHH